MNQKEVKNSIIEEGESYGDSKSNTSYEWLDQSYAETDSVRNSCVMDVNKESFNK